MTARGGPTARRGQLRTSKLGSGKPWSQTPRPMSVASRTAMDRDCGVHMSLWRGKSVTYPVLPYPTGAGCRGADDTPLKQKGPCTRCRSPLGPFAHETWDSKPGDMVAPGSWEALSASFTREGAEGSPPGKPTLGLELQCAGLLQ